MKNATKSNKVGGGFFSAIKNKLVVKYNSDDINVVRLRVTLGWLALLLPWIVSLTLWQIPDSISATYYTYESGPLFMIILGSCAILLTAYKGYERVDDILNTVAGCFGLMICMFPCNNPDLAYVGTFQIPTNISKYIHNGSAVVFFGLLAINSLFLFTKHGAGEMTAKKKKRNIIYKICGIGMIASFALFILPDFYAKTWLIETIALFFFGLSFLTKSNVYKFLFAEESPTVTGE